MKKLIFIIASSYSMAAFAQDGFFLAPAAGAGIGNTHTNLYQENSPFVYSVGLPQKTFSCTGELLLGYRFKNWEVTSGVSFLRSGYSESYNAGDFVGYAVTYTERDYHIAVPLMLAYRVKCCSRFFLMAGAGVAASYNWYATTNETEQIIGSTIETKKDATLRGSDFDARYNKVSLLAKGQVQIGYQLSPRLGVTAGPEAQYMLTSFLKNANNYQRNYTYTFNAGVRWELKKNNKPKTSTN